MDIGAGELLVILAIVILLFGPGRLANVGGELGKAIHNFREGLQKGQSADASPATPEPAPQPPDSQP